MSQRWQESSRHWAHPRGTLRNWFLQISGCRDSWSEFTGISSFKSFLHLQDIEVNEYDLTADALFPASLTNMTLVDWGKPPSFPFTKNLAARSLPIHLQSISSYSRAPDLLRRMLEGTWNSHEVELQYCKLHDSLPTGSYRVPESPS